MVITKRQQHRVKTRKYVEYRKDRALKRKSTKIQRKTCNSYNMSCYYKRSTRKDAKEIKAQKILSPKFSTRVSTVTSTVTIIFPQKAITCSVSISTITKLSGNSALCTNSTSRIIDITTTMSDITTPRSMISQTCNAVVYMGTSHTVHLCTIKLSIP